MRAFIGFDERQPLAYHVCRSSIERHARRRIEHAEHRHLNGTVSWTELIGRSVHVKHIRPR